MIVAIIPAAGEGARMGKPKLTLPIGGSTVIARVVSALMGGGLDRILVVTPPIDAPGSAELGREASGAGAVVLVTDVRPLDMRGSVEHALSYIEANLPETTAVILTPADVIGITPELTARVRTAALADPDAIIAPVFNGKRGHPIVIPWSIAAEIRHLPADVGVNALLKRHANRIREIVADNDALLHDLDTPEDYEAWNRRIMMEGRDSTDKDQPS